MLVDAQKGPLEDVSATFLLGWRLLEDRPKPDGIFIGGMLVADQRIPTGSDPFLSSAFLTAWRLSCKS